MVVALGLSVQLMAAPGARAEDDVTGSVATGLLSALATVIALPVRVATCLATVTIGGATYGVTMGSSEFVNEEILGSVPYACGARINTLPLEVEPLTRAPEEPR